MLQERTVTLTDEVFYFLFRLIRYFKKFFTTQISGSRNQINKLKDKMNESEKYCAKLKSLIIELKE